jgi:hypothetical protein
VLSALLWTTLGDPLTLWVRNQNITALALSSCHGKRGRQDQRDEHNAFGTPLSYLIKETLTPAKTYRTREDTLGVTRGVDLESFCLG